MRRRKRPKWEKVHLRDINSYAVSLGDLFEELASRHPGLRIGRDDKRDVGSRPVDDFGDHRNELTLWHGTTEDRARAIVSEGFASPYPGGGIWMTREHSYARSHAINRAQHRRQAAMLFCCRVNLDEYSDFARRGPHFVFGCSHISMHVIRKAFRLEFRREVPDQEEVIKLIDVAITRDSREQDVLRWINECLKLIGEQAVDESHPAVEAMFRWIQAQYAAGRDGPMTEEEMLLKMSDVSINHASRHFRVGTQAIERWIDKGRLRFKSLRECPIVPLNLQDVQVKKERNIIKLWYATTEDKAKAIVEEGFKRSEVRFNSKLPVARRIAIDRARQRNGVPAVISCEIDLEKYTSFGKRGSDTYVFYTPVGKEVTDGVTIGKEVIRDVSIVDARSPRHREDMEYRRTIDVAVTRTSGKLGVLWWINRYLELEGAAEVDEKHDAVKAISRWVDAQYAEGRDAPISDEEMLAQVRKYFNTGS